MVSTHAGSLNRNMNKERPPITEIKNINIKSKFFKKWFEESSFKESGNIIEK